MMDMEPKQILAQLAEQLDRTDLENVKQREALISNIRDLAQSLERERDSLYRIYHNSVEAAALTVALQMGLIQTLAETTTAQTAQDLAKLAPGRNDQLIDRIMRCLASFGIVSETESGYLPNNVTRNLSREETPWAMDHYTDIVTPGLLKLPAQLKRIDYQDPLDPKYTAFSLALNMDGADPFEIASKTPSMVSTNKWFKALHAPFQPWFIVYPLLDRWPNPTTSPGVFVDVGGGLGHQAMRMKQANPTLPCKYIVQDQEKIVGPNAHLADEDIQFQAIDFFQEQPIQHATIYYLRHIIHDWPDKEAVQILTRMRQAMKPGYSKLLLNEWIVPEKGAHPFLTSCDITMMAICSARERTAEQYTELLRRAGLRVTGVFLDENDVKNQSVIEAVVDEEAS